MSAAGNGRPSSIGEKLIAWSIASLGFLATVYFAWLRLPVALWHWANEAWWHWVVAICALPLLLIAPLFVLLSARQLIAAPGAGVRSHLGWETVSYLGALGVGVLILWAFTPAPEWWAGWHWWLWGATLVLSAAVSAGGRMFCTVYEVGVPKVRDTYSAEWKFNHGDVNSPPTLGIAMSGGGIRSAAFNLGVLHALHAKGILRDVDVMSAVSGGSYTMSWYLLQPFYAAKAADSEHKDFKLDDVLDEMFRPDGRFQKYLCEDPSVAGDWMEIGIGAVMDMTFFEPLRAFAAASGHVGLYNNTGFGREEYRNHLQKLFQGLPSTHSKYEITNEIDWPARQELNLDHSDFFEVTPVGYRELAEFLQRNRLPFFVFNATVLVRGAYRHMLWPTGFEFTARDVGSDAFGYRTWDDLRHLEVTEHFSEGMSIQQWSRRRLDKRDTELREHRWFPMVNLASAISGAAIGLSYFNPKKSLGKMRLTTWTPFVGNFDLGYIIFRDIWNEKGALYVSDGGHCENLGAYALIKRQCRKIIIVDAEHEVAIPYVFAGYAKLKRQLAQEMHLELAISDIDAYLESAKGFSKPSGPTAAVMTGEVKPMRSPAGARPTSVIYVKLGLDRNRLDSYPKNVSEYAHKNSEFPQDPTSNQSFTSEQFIAYRDLGRHVAHNLDQTIAAMT
jgi:hypothetical protein